MAFAHLAYDVRTALTMAEYLSIARRRGATWIYVTDDTLSNPWDRLPAYWDEEVAAARENNAAEPIMLEAALLAPESVRIQIDGIPGRYVLESSLDLLQWQFLDSAVLSTGRVEIIAPIVPGPARYLRAWR